MTVVMTGGHKDTSRYNSVCTCIKETDHRRWSEKMSPQKGPTEKNKN